MIRKLIKKFLLKRKKKYIDIKKTSILGDNFYLRIDAPSKSYRLSIGDNSFVDGQYIFEKESGFVKIGSNCHIGNSTFISINGIEIEDDVTIAWGCTFYDHNSHSIYWKERAFDTYKEISNLKKGKNPIADKDWSVVSTKPIKICSKAWIGMNCLILKGVTIGEHSIVGAGSVVTKDVPPFSVVGGNPAAIIKKLPFEGD